MTFRSTVTKKKTIFSLHNILIVFTFLSISSIVIFSNYELYIKYYTN